MIEWINNWFAQNQGFAFIIGVAFSGFLVAIISWGIKASKRAIKKRKARTDPDEIIIVKDLETIKEHDPKIQEIESHLNAFFIFGGELVYIVWRILLKNYAFWPAYILLIYHILIGRAVEGILMTMAVAVAVAFERSKEK